MINPFNPFFSISDKTAGFGNKAVIFAAIALVASKYSLKLSKIPFLNLEIPSDISMPTSGVFSILCIYFLILFLTNYFEELASFENSEYEEIIQDLDSQIDDNAKSAQTRKLANDVRKQLGENIGIWKFFGLIQTILNFSLPVIVCGYTIYFDWGNIIDAFGKLLP